MGGLFRGVRAPASLKRAEARRPRERDAALFRGVRAPASLKPGDLELNRPQPLGLFRGVRAPASLKRPCHFAFSCALSGPLPGRTRPGLIEAGPTDARLSALHLLFRGVRAPASLKLNLQKRAFVADALTSSGAYAPRPH